MRRLDLLSVLAAVLLSSSAGWAAKASDYCTTHRDSPECYCQATAHASELKCLRFLGSNAGFSSDGAGTSAIFNDNQSTRPAAQLPSAAAERPSSYILFIHYGAPKDMANLPDVTSLVNKFKQDGYIVRGADARSDPSGGAGIDYFREEDQAAAKRIADSAHSWLKENGKAADLAPLEPRRQQVRNPPGHIGVWIFGRPAKR